MQKILDLHIHSRYSRACSKDLELSKIAQTCEIRGIDIVTTGDFTHPKWFESIKNELVEDTAGIYRLKTPPQSSPVRLSSPKSDRGGSPTRFMIGTEVASIKKHKDKTRRVHHLLFAPSIEVAEKFNKKLENTGFNLKADGRPILGMTSKQILETMLEIDERMVMIPAHAWTPWFGIFGSKGGYDTLEEAFEELTPRIFSIETGLSSDPLMNAQLSMLDRITLISNSDAHSPQKLGREANVFDFENEKDITYEEIMRILREKDTKRFKYTIEFYPEEGKYHYDGHAVCKFSCHPRETKKYGGICPVCKKSLVIGVMNRIEVLSDRTESEAKSAVGIPYKSLVPLPEIIADTLGVGVATKGVKKIYDGLISNLGNEFSILTEASLLNIEKWSNAGIADAVDRVRKGNIHIVPGYDGIFGVVKVFEKINVYKNKQIDLEL